MIRGKMKINEINLFDQGRSRFIPVLIYTADNIEENSKVVLFNPGYQKQDNLQKLDVILEYKQWSYLAEYFTSKGYVFISVQHDILGDNDGLETIDSKANQAEARNHLWVRGEENILFVIQELKNQYSHFDFKKFIIAGHSNGADLAKFYANNHEENISSIISFDGRRCPIAPFAKQKLLMFEAWDTSTDIGVIPDEGTETAPKRKDLEWIVVKPQGAVHMDYQGSKITERLKRYVLRVIEFFLSE
jgi:hypothetical protein